MRNENLIKSLKILINKPNKFIDSKMDKIIEEIESIRDFESKNIFKMPETKSEFKIEDSNSKDPTIKAIIFMNNHLFIKKIN